MVYKGFRYIYFLNEDRAEQLKSHYKEKGGYWVNGLDGIFIIDKGFGMASVKGLLLSLLKLMKVDEDARAEGNINEIQPNGIFFESGFNFQPFTASIRGYFTTIIHEMDNVSMFDEKDSYVIEMIEAQREFAIAERGVELREGEGILVKTRDIGEVFSEIE
jgi:hypothetical protein